MAHHPSASGSRPVPRVSWHPTDYLRVLYKRRWVAIPGFLLVFLSGAIGSIRTVPVYEARTQLVIEKDARRATSLNTVMEERESWYQDDFYPTQYRILQSRTLAARTAGSLATEKAERVPASSGMSFSLSGVVASAVDAVSRWLGPDALPVVPAGETTSSAPAVSSAMTDRVQAGVQVVPIRNSRLVDLKFRSPDPEFAARVINLHAAQYIEQSLEFRMDATTQTNAWLNGQLEEQRQLVEQSERSLQDYKELNNATSVDDKQNIVVQKLNALNEQVVQARIERTNKEVQVNAIAEMLAGGQSLEAFPAVLASPVVQKLRADLVTKESERARLGTQYGPAYPAMRDLASQIETGRRDLASEIDKVVSGIRAEFQNARAREIALQESLDTQQRESFGLDRKMLEYAALEREAVSNRQLYQNLMARAKETGAAVEYRGTSIQVLDRAEVPVLPVLPRVQRDLMLAALSGILLAFGLAFGFEYFDSRIKLPEEIKAHLNLPFLGMIPVFPGGEQGGEAPLLQPDAPPAFSEAIRAVRTALLFSTADPGSRSVVVTSTGPHEGKTVVSSSLAITLAQAGQRTIVVDADMRRPRMHDALGRTQEPGLSNVLVGDASLADATRSTAVPNLSLLAAGHIPPNPVELLCSPQYAALMAELKRNYDWVVIDAPPVMPVTDAAVVANTSGGVIFVVGSEMTPRQNAAAAVEQLRGANAKFVGAVLNRVDIQKHAYYYSPYFRKEYGKYYQRSPNQA
jgi:succinoglycan biosynthesis transport protein ExoP